MVSIRQIEKKEQFCQAIDVEVITNSIGLDIIDEVLETCGARERRIRKLPARVVILLCIMMNIFTDMGLTHVMLQMVSGLRWLSQNPIDVIAGRNSMSEARYRLGVKPMQLLFKRICRPIATRQTPGAFAYGLRLVAFDGRRQDLADSADNERHFGRPTGGARGPWPQMDIVHLCECGTRVIFDVFFGAYGSSERQAAQRLLRSIKPGMLLLWDSGFYSVELILQAQQRGAQLLGRLPGYVKPEIVRVLPDGSYWAYLYPGDYQARKTGKRVLVRVIEYTIDDPQRTGHGQLHRLFTTLFDPIKYPSLELIGLYHERWEIEIAFDEIATHQLLVNRPLRSRKPVGVMQELYGLLLAHFIIRSLIGYTAHAQQLDPDCLSFVHAVRLLKMVLPTLQLLDPQHHPAIWQQLANDLAHPRHRLPPRANRINPRVVKRRTSRFARKNLSHYALPKLTLTFSQSVLLLHPSPP
ncbi:MAG: IS4 family transposase [Phototrophicales bacterium]|nr:MAG: IS4 family transposase [Phototrophicales bacterium]